MTAMIHSKKTALFAVITTATLLLGACSDKDAAQVEPAATETTTETTIVEPVATETTTDAQTPVEQEATGVATATDTTVDTTTTNDDVAVASTNDDAVAAPATNDDVAVGTTNDTTVIDGTETQENISTN
ncbi:hypothetical protein [Psychrobacter sp. I-STPA10]|uniref:hypothetical protein n=1 Tax=Psychrobacter sp. I-STPA10 TaxID=2585769 RepID=UPI001E62C088|nr:hypothetical protein [Psychrobacter sp. I-STPA10]